MSLLGLPIKRKVFVSYHHEYDQWWANFFSNQYAERYDIFYDSSLDDEIDSEDPEYINRAIRENYIVGTSITIVLCGAETWKRRYVDWEIYSTLHHKHALLGVALPTAVRDAYGNIIVPDRFYINYQSGYAHWMTWPADTVVLKNDIEIALSKSKLPAFITNSQSRMKRNKS